MISSSYIPDPIKSQHQMFPKQTNIFSNSTPILKTVQSTIVLFFILLTIKILFLYSFGPQEMLDSHGYRQFSQLIQNDPTWYQTLDLNHGEFLPIQAYRLPFYPLLLAIFNITFGENGEFILIIFQTIISIIPILLLHRISTTMAINKKLSGTILLLVFFSPNLYLDQTIMADSLGNSVFLSILLRLYLGILKGEIKTGIYYFSLGSLQATCLLIKEIYWIFSIFPVLLLLHNISRTSSKDIFKRFAFIIPVIFTAFGVLKWNEVRSGQRFITMGEAPYFGPSLQIPHFDKRFPLDRYLKKNLKSSHFHDWEKTRRDLHYVEGWSTLEIGSAMRSRFYRSLAHHPVDHLKLYFLNQASYSGVILNPFFNILCFSNSLNSEDEWILGVPRLTYFYYEASPYLKLVWFVVSIVFFLLYWIPVFLSFRLFFKLNSIRILRLFPVLFLIIGTSLFSLIHVNPRYVCFAPAIWVLIVFNLLKHHPLQVAVIKTDSPR